MSWGDDEAPPPVTRFRQEYMTIGPYRFPHERDRDCNELAAAGDWFMHSCWVDNQGHYTAVMARSVPI